MTYSISTHGMSCIYSLAQAAKFWSEQPVWKGRSASWKPLDSTRMPHKRIVKLADDKGYELTLYGTPMVTYFADGRVALRCYDSFSSMTFAWRVCPPGCRPTSQKGRMYWEVDTPEGKRFYKEDTIPLMLTPTGDGAQLWRLTTEPLTEKEWHYDPKLGAQARKIIKPYCQWHNVMVRLTGAMPPGATWSGQRKQAARALIDDPDNVELYPQIAESLGYPADARKYAYLEFGARYQTDAPHDHLPKGSI